MQRFIICLLLTIFISLAAVRAQTDTPRYYYSNYASVGATNTCPFWGTYAKTQCFYYASNFPGMPATPIKAVYFRLLQPFYAGTPPQAVFTNFTVKIGYTDSFGFTKPNGTYNNYITGLTTVYGPATLVMGNGYGSGSWFRIPITKNGFNYTPEKKFIVEIDMGPRVKQGGMYIISSKGDGVNWRAMSSSDGIGDSTRADNAGKSVMDLGFEPGIPTLDVEEAGSITELILYPNPSNGSFTIGCNARKPLGRVSLTLSSITGQAVLRKEYGASGAAFSAEVDAGSLPRGMYFLKLEADGETLSRKLTLQ